LLRSSSFLQAKYQFFSDASAFSAFSFILAANLVLASVAGRLMTPPIANFLLPYFRGALIATQGALTYAQILKVPQEEKSALEDLKKGTYLNRLGFNKKSTDHFSKTVEPYVFSISSFLVFTTIYLGMDMLQIAVPIFFASILLVYFLTTIPRILLFPVYAVITVLDFFGRKVLKKKRIF
jgi:hypothetical protein